MICATEIYQANLDAVSAGMMTGDFHAFFTHIGMPIMMATGSREVVVSSYEEMLILVTEYREQLLSQGMVDFRRFCLWADWQPAAPDMIMGCHRTEIRSVTGYVIPPYQCQLALMRIDGVWKAIWEQANVAEDRIEFLAADIALAQEKAHAVLSARARTLEGGGARG